MGVGTTPTSEERHRARGFRPYSQGPRGKREGSDLRSGKAKSSQELLPKYIEQDAKQGPQSQFVERAGSGLKAVPQQQRGAWAEFTSAGVRIGTSLSFSVVKVSSVLPPYAARRGAAH